MLKELIVEIFVPLRGSDGGRGEIATGYPVTREYYVNGVSTSLPYEVQLQFIRSIAGLEQAAMRSLAAAPRLKDVSPTLAAVLEPALLGQLLHRDQDRRVGHLAAPGDPFVHLRNRCLAQVPDDLHHFRLQLTQSMQ